MNYYIVIKDNSYEVVDGKLNLPEREVILDTDKIESLACGLISFYYDANSTKVNRLATDLDHSLSQFDGDVMGDEVIIEPHQAIIKKELITLLNSLIKK